MKTIKSVITKLINFIFGTKQTKEQFKVKEDTFGSKSLPIETLKVLVDKNRYSDKNYMMIPEINQLLTELCMQRGKSLDEVYLYWDGDFSCTSELLFIEYYDYDYVVDIGGITYSSWSKPMMKVYDFQGNEFDFVLPYSSEGVIMKDVNKVLNNIINELDKVSEDWGDF